MVRYRGKGPDKTTRLLLRGLKRAHLIHGDFLEATRRGAAASIQFVRGDFMAVSSELPMTPVVVFDRVICCYPDYEAFLTRAFGHADQALAFSYPRDRWYVRAHAWLQNRRRSRTCLFRTFVHPEKRMKRLVEDAGFRLVSHKTTFTWSADVFVKGK